MYMPYGLSRYVIRYFIAAYGVQQNCISLPRHLSAIWTMFYVEVLAMQVNPGTHRKSKHHSALTTRRTASLANALDDSFYEESPEMAHYAAGVLIDDQDETRPLIQATPVGDLSRNRSQSSDCFVCAGDRRLLA